MVTRASSERFAAGILYDWCRLLYFLATSYTSAMKKDVLLMLLGTFIVALPFLGFTNTWDTVMMVIVGVSVIAVAITVRRAKKPPTPPQLFSNQPQLEP